MSMPHVAPLCPAGHLPRKGGDRPAARFSPLTNVAGSCEALRQSISSLAGEMSGRTEGGAKGTALPVHERAQPSFSFADGRQPAND